MVASVVAGGGIDCMYVRAVAYAVELLLLQRQKNDQVGAAFRPAWRREAAAAPAVELEGLERAPI